MEKYGVVCVNTTKESAEVLANKLGIQYHILNPKEGDITSPFQFSINWGVSRVQGKVILNKPRAIRRCMNKLRTFELLKDHVRLPTLTLDRDEAKSWISQGRSVVMRDRIKGARNQGIVITKNITVFDQTPAKFYTRFIDRCSEYRFNCFRGEILSTYKKIKTVNTFRFKIQMGMEPDEYVQVMAQKVHEHLKIDMYGMDVLLSPGGKWFFLECNSGPVLFNITANRIKKCIQEYLIFHNPENINEEV